jgi:hypothetical protein
MLGWAGLGLGWARPGLGWPGLKRAGLGWAGLGWGNSSTNLVTHEAFCSPLIYSLIFAGAPRCTASGRLNCTYITFSSSLTGLTSSGITVLAKPSSHTELWSGLACLHAFLLAFVPACLLSVVCCLLSVWSFVGVQWHKHDFLLLLNIKIWIWKIILMSK